MGIRRGKNVPPLYAQIAEDLRYKILSEEWKVNETIPPELALCETYEVSRITIRKAIDELVREGLLYRERARGTVVIDWNHDVSDKQSTKVKSFTKEMQEIGEKAVTLHAEVKLVNADKRLASFFQVEKGTEILRLKRTRGTPQKVFAYFVTYVPYNYNYSLDSRDYYGSFYNYLREFGIVATQEREYIEAIKPPIEVWQALNISSDEPVLKRVRMVSHLERNYKEYSECFYIGNQYRYYVDFI